MKQKIFFVGIGGKGLNGIARICLEKGYEISGVDESTKPETISLENEGVKIYTKHSENNIDEDVDVVVYTSIAKNAPEVLIAQKLGIPTMKRSRFLQQLTGKDFKICVAGSHGKSTTTAVLGLSMINSGTDATIFGGAYAKELGGYNHVGKSKYSIIEACEYDRSFHDLIGNISVITSVEKSHMEYYKDEKEMIESFNEFVSQHDVDSKIIAYGDDSKVYSVSLQSRGDVVHFGFGKFNDYIITDVDMGKTGSTFSVIHKKKKIVDHITIKIPGKYNILNFVAGIAVMNELNLDISGIYTTAKSFTGVGRRFEVCENKYGQVLIDDFAHHPSQVKSLFNGIKQFYPSQKICAIFQPRQYNLISNFIKEYGESFEKADEIILTNILPALGDTEKDINSINIEDIIESIHQRSHKPVRLMNSFSEIVEYVKSKYKENSVITTIGAGDIYQVRDQLIS